jgi:hypothetical protein
MTTTMNGNVRKSLAEQIDRLDTILDGLAEGLTGAVADAVRATVGLAVKEAVQAVLIEVLSNPAVLVKLRGTEPEAPAPRKPSHVAQVVGMAKVAASTAWATVRKVCAAGVRSVEQVAVAVLHHRRRIWTFRAPLLVALAAGVVSGTAAFVAGPWVAATAGTLAGFTAAASAQLALALRRMLTRITVSNVQP